MRQSQVSRITLETDINISVNIDGVGKPKLEFKPRFMQHMLTAMTVHSGFDINLTAKGDLNHHIVEDIALCLGNAIRECIDDINAIARYGQAIVPMDCSLALVAIDISNRPYSVVDIGSIATSIEDTRVEDIVHFIESLATSMGATIHVKVLHGINGHHKIESVFKALGMALKQALRIREVSELPSSSKGVL